MSLSDMYDDLARILSGSTAMKVRRHFNVPGMDNDDVRQEAHVSVLKAMAGYDFNRADGELVPFMRRVTDNTYKEVFARSRRLYRNPHASVVDESGRKRLVVLPQAEYDAVDEHSNGRTSASRDACDEILEQESIIELGAFLNSFMDELGPRERAVLEARLHPPTDLRALMEHFGEDEYPSNVVLAQYLGLGKAELDWAWYKIRMAFTELAGRPAFSELFGEDVGYRGWPKIHLSRGTRYHGQFVSRTLHARRLDSRPLRAAQVEQSALGERSIEDYKWGVVVRCRLDDVYWTAVLEGRFAPRTGELFGAYGTRVLVRIPGYARLAKSITEAPLAAAETPHRQAVVLPACISEYEAGQPVCDAPCPRRNECVAMRMRMRQKNTKVSAYVEIRQDARGAAYATPLDAEKWQKITSKIIHDYQVIDGRAQRTAPLPSPRGQSKAGVESKAKRDEETARTRANLSKGRGAPAPLPKVAAQSQMRKIRRGGAPAPKVRSKKSKALDVWLKGWLVAIVEATGRSFSKDDELAKPGQLFLRDRRLLSNYVALYCRAADGSDVPVAYLNYKANVQLMDMKFPVGPENMACLSSKTMKTLKPVVHKDGSWRSIATGLDQMKVGLGAEAVCQLIQSGTIVLPDV